MFCITCSICETTHDVTLYTKQVDLWALSLEFLLEFRNYSGSTTMMLPANQE